MATQKEAYLDVLESVRFFVADFRTPTPKHEKAKQAFLKLVDKRIGSTNAQIGKYNAAREQSKEPVSNT